eukprot:CAMPEP_0168405228 /NCGR_PEP_ID=MMETSP0228-20121227/25036_1 /TAXON_ID=133427 /ORGANISM="Protoceratium reticulatum, Strain CCCM 535 (=CCMP 1889)" /LENGTH=175 /DNA_ID=CAMNT_0008418855 /DNA_START=55 /DNA_END=580 /DNA_ORIENTATION=-
MKTSALSWNPGLQPRGSCRAASPAEAAAGVREGLLLAGVVEEERHPFRVVHQLVHHGAVSEAAHVLLQALDTSRCDLDNLLGVQPRKALPDVHSVELPHELVARLRGPEVDEAVPDITLVLEIDRQIHEIKLPIEVDSQLLDEHLASVLVRDVPQHHGRVNPGLLRLLGLRLGHG